MSYTYPASDFDLRERQVAAVGTFWSNVYAGGDLVRSLLHARAQAAAQADDDLHELLDSVSRIRMPVFHAERWYSLRLRQNAVNKTTVNLTKYDGSRSYDDGLAYDTFFSNGFFCWELPEGIKNVAVVVNRITDSSMVLVKGEDFLVRDGVICFRVDPFTSPLTSVREIVEDNEVVDREAALWLYRGKFDHDNVYRQFGYAVGIRKPSGQRYKDLVNAAYDGLVEGTSMRCVQDAFSAMTDVPLVQSDGETVQQIENDARWQWIITDKQAYRFSQIAVPIVAVGDVVNAGDALTDALRFFGFNRGQVPDEIQALAVGRGFLASGFLQDVVFENKMVPWQISTDGGLTRMEFEIGGFPADTEKFWDDVHASGVTRGQTLANLLDTRTNKTGEPTAVALPSTVNPLGFLLQNVFRCNMTVVKLKPGAFGPDALGLGSAALVLQKLVPPPTAMIVLVELQHTQPVVKMEGSETGSVFLGTTISDPINLATSFDETLKAYQIAGRCE